MNIIKTILTKFMFTIMNLMIFVFIFSISKTVTQYMIAFAIPLIGFSADYFIFVCRLVAGGERGDNVSGWNSLVANFKSSLSLFLKFDFDVPKMKRNKALVLFVMCCVVLGPAIPIYIDHFASDKFKFLVYAGFYDLTKNYSDERRVLSALAKERNVHAQFQLGFLNEKGLGGAVDYRKAAKWYSLAAEQGYVRAIGAMGFFYGSGLGVAANCTMALKMYQKSIDYGYAPSMRNMAALYYKGICVPKDYKKVFLLVSQAANKGDRLGILFMGDCYNHGIGVPKNSEKAKDIYLPLAKTGLVAAQIELALLLLGEDSLKDEDEAKKWLVKASNQGNSRAKKILKELDDQ